MRKFLAIVFAFAMIAPAMAAHRRSAVADAMPTAAQVQDMLPRASTREVPGFGLRTLRLISVTKHGHDYVVRVRMD